MQLEQIKGDKIIQKHYLSMTKQKKYKLEMEKVKLKTLLVYPPLFPSDWPPPPLGIPILHGFLKGKGYKNIESIDINSICYDKLWFKKIFSLVKTFLCSWSVYKTRRASRTFHFLQATPELSLEKMLDIAVKDLSTEKEAKKISKIISHLITKKKPDIVGITVSYPLQIFYALLIARIVKGIKNDTFVVLGGPLLDKHINFLIRDKALLGIVDGFVEGDGEGPLAELIYRLDKGESLESVPNFYFKNPDFKNGCYYVRTRYNYVYNPKEVVMPDFSGFKIKKVLPIRASVGCPWGKCTFCTWPKFHKKNICANPKDILFLMKELIKKYKINRFEFIDDSLDANFLRKFSKLVLKKKLKIRWSCYLHLQPEFGDETFVESLANSGCKNVCFGVESMSPRILKLMNKIQKDPETVRKILKLFKKYQINPRISIMIGFPSETEEEAKKTIDFLLNESELYSIAVVQHFALENDMPILKNLSKFGISKVYGLHKFSKRLGLCYKTKEGMTNEESKRLIDYTNDILDQKRKR